jgi:hypothetical protein
MIQLTVKPRFIFTGLGKPGNAMKEQYRADLLGSLTRGWDEWTIMRDLKPEELANLPSSLAMGRVKLPPLKQP